MTFQEHKPSVPESDQPTGCAHNGGHLIWRAAHVKGLRDPFLRHAGLFRDDVREQGFGWCVLRDNLRDNKGTNQ